MNCLILRVAQREIIIPFTHEETEIQRNQVTSPYFPCNRAGLSSDPDDPPCYFQLI